MTEHSDLPGEAGQEYAFEREVRGYSRRQVDEFVARARSQSRDLENRLSHALDENERLRLELSSARQAASGKPAHEEVSERVGQILKLADDEAKAQRARVTEEIAKLRADAKQETDKLRADVSQEVEKFRADAQAQAERMLNAAQEQAESTISAARNEADKTTKAARADAERVIAEANKQAESALASAKSQAKQMLDEATARATAIHDGAERRLNLLMSRHTEAVRRLTEIRDVVTNLVAGEAARGSLEDEVAKSVASALSQGPAGAQPAAAGQSSGPRDPRDLRDPRDPRDPRGAAASRSPGPASRPVGPPRGRSMDTPATMPRMTEPAGAGRPIGVPAHSPGPVGPGGAGGPGAAGTAGTVGSTSPGQHASLPPSASGRRDAGAGPQQPPQERPGHAGHAAD